MSTKIGWPVPAPALPEGVHPVLAEATETAVTAFRRHGERGARRSVVGLRRRGRH
jgi:hypothetical protein